MVFTSALTPLLKGTTSAVKGFFADAKANSLLDKLKEDEEEEEQQQRET
jgi:primosomal replication protein N